MSHRDTPDPAVATLLPPIPSSTKAARAFAREMLDAWQLPTAYDDVAPIVDELVTNAIRYGGEGPILLALDRREDRGLPVIATLAQSWGAERHNAAGTSVWAELAINRH